MSNRVFSNVKSYVQTIYPSAHFQNTRDFSSASLPAVAVIQIDNSEVGNDLNLWDFTDDPMVRSGIEVQVYSNKSSTEAKKITGECCKAMRAMNYARTYGAAEITDNSSPNLYRWVARFERIVSGLDEIPSWTHEDIDRFIRLAEDGTYRIVESY